MKKWSLVILFISIYGCTSNVSELDKSELVGSWWVEFISERPVIDRSPAFIQFTEDDTVNGNASCNNFSSSYTFAETQLSFGQSVSTRMACPPALMEQEQRFLAALNKVAQVTLENGMLELTDADGMLVFKASRQDHIE